MFDVYCRKNSTKKKEKLRLDKKKTKLKKEKNEKSKTIKNIKII